MDHGIMKSVDHLNLRGRYQNGELFSRPLQNRTLSKWRINDRKVRHFDKRPKITEFSKWRTFIGRSYQNGELFESEILVARKSLLVICKLKRLDVLRQFKPLCDIFA